MFRDTIQILACLALLTSANSLHMARDAFHRPTSDLGIVDFIDDTSDEIQSQHEQNHQTPLEQSSSSSASSAATGSNYHNRRGPYTVHDQQINLSPNSIDQFARSSRDRQDTPRALQELFAGPSTLDIRLEQQKQLNQQEQQHQNKRASVSTTSTNGEAVSTGNSGSGSSASSGSSGKHILPQVTHGIASQLMLRSARGQRNYDVPQIGEYKVCHFFLYTSNFKTNEIFYNVAEILSIIIISPPKRFTKHYRFEHLSINSPQNPPNLLLLIVVNLRLFGSLNMPEMSVSYLPRV